MSSQELEATQLEPRDGPSVAEMPCVPLSSPGVFATQVDTQSTVEEAPGEEVINPEPASGAILRDSAAEQEKPSGRGRPLAPDGHP